jgi:type I restriction enzyme M protein
MLQNNKKLKSLIVSLWDTFWSSGIANPITAIEQISYLLFIRRLDELETINEADLKYKSIFSGEYTPYFNHKKYEVTDKMTDQKKVQLNNTQENASQSRSKNELKWSSFRDMSSADEMLEHVRYNVFPFIKELREDSTPFARSMVDAVFTLKKPSLLKEAINKIEEIYVEIDRDAQEGGYAFQDIQGDVYEMLLGELSQAGKNGQFRTPRHIINLMAELVEPKITHRIADPACGTSGFLLGAYQYILTDIVREKDPSKLIKDDDGFERGINSTFLDSEQKERLDKNLCGFDIDPNMVRLGLMNLMMHGIAEPQIENQDTLSNAYNENENFDIVLANPPFTGKLDKDDINNELGIDTRSTELLFLSRISKMLRTNGKAAVIIPEGVLFGSSKAQKATRELLLKDNCLEAVVSLPSGVFKPYTGVKTSILVFKKIKEKSEAWNTDKVWFYEIKNDGYSLDDNRRKLKNNPLPKVKSLFDGRGSEKYDNRKNYFFVELNEIQENNLDLSYNRYKEYEYIEQTYEPPKVILEKLIKLEKDILTDLDELNGLIG